MSASDACGAGSGCWSSASAPPPFAHWHGPHSLRVSGHVSRRACVGKVCTERVCIGNGVYRDMACIGMAYVRMATLRHVAWEGSGSRGQPVRWCMEQWGAGSRVRGAGAEGRRKQGEGTMGRRKQCGAGSSAVPMASHDDRSCISVPCACAWTATLVQCCWCSVLLV